MAQKFRFTFRSDNVCGYFWSKQSMMIDNLDTTVFKGSSVQLTAGQTSQVKLRQPVKTGTSTCVCNDLATSATTIARTADTTTSAMSATRGEPHGPIVIPSPVAVEVAAMQTTRVTDGVMVTD